MAASVDRERFAQERLEHYYNKMKKKLSPWKDVILFVQDVLTWKKPPFSLLLFVAVHWLFYQFVVAREGVVSLFFKLCLVGAVCDMIVRMATAKGDGQESTSRRRGLRGVTEAVRERVGRKLDNVTFDQAVMESHSSRPEGVVFPFAQVCLQIAQISLWGEMTWLALLVQWGKSPSSIASLAIGLGVSLIVVSKVLPGVVLAYLLVMALLVWPYVECYHILDLLVARIQPWLERVDWKQLKALVFPEERQADYDFALGGDMTSSAFAQAVRGQKVVGPAPQPHPHAGGSGDAPSSAVQPVSYQPYPEEGSSGLQGPPQPSPEASLAELDPQYDSLLVDLAPKLEYMPSISYSEMGTIDEGSGSDVEELPELDEYDYHPSTPAGGTGRAPAQSRKKKRRLPLPKLRRKAKRSHDAAAEGNPQEIPAQATYHTPSSSNPMTTPSAPPMPYHSTPMDSTSPPSYEEATKMDHTTAYADYYRQQARQPF